ncbi:MAG: MCE family protein [Myxococcales bacterium]|nr:MCE family protein [Myxococcales bacterium]MCB9647127.1 MCE family protein [Deltaproteobacteria bacterium]
MILTRAEKVRLGAFLMVGASVLFGSILVLAGLKLWERRDVYYVSFHESVTGLEASAAVRYQGLRVGRVEALGVDPEDPTAIRATLSLESGTVLFEGTKAVLDMSGLTGLKTVNLSPGNPQQPRLQEGATIPETPSLVGRIGDRAELISERIERVTANLMMWTGPENRQRVERFVDTTEKLLSDVDVLVVEAKDPLVAALEEVTRSGAALRETSGEVTLALRDVRGELRETLVAARSSLQEVQRILKAVDSQAVANTIKSADSALAALDARLNDAELQQTLDDLQVALTNVTKLVQNLDLTVRASREDLVLSLKYVRQASEDLREFSRIIAQDPSVLLRGTEVRE